MLSIPEYRFTSAIKTTGDRIVIGYRNTDYDSFTEENTSHGIWYNYKITCGFIIFDPVSGEWTDAEAVLDGESGTISTLY